MTQIETPDPSRLPPHQPNSAYVSIVPFETGRMATATRTLVEGAQGPSVATSWRFLIHHPRTNTHIWFDMGICHDLTVYPPAVQAVHAHFKPAPSPTSIDHDTSKCGVPSSRINHVIVSHAHWDHIYPLPISFNNANMICGPGSTAHCAPGYPKDPKSKFDGRIWDSSIRQFELVELPPVAEGGDAKGKWQPLGPFPNAYDFFDDGSFYLLDMPGHMPGNLAALARVAVKNPSFSTAVSMMDGGAGTPNGLRHENVTHSCSEASQYALKFKYVLLAGDCAHCNIFTYWPEAPFGRMPVELFPSGCLHEDPVEARETIRRIGKCKAEEGQGLLVWWAHGELLEGLWEM